MSASLAADRTEDPRETSVSLAILGSVAVLTLFFTVLHHGFPQVLDVPSNRGLYLSSYPAMFAMDLGVIAMSWLCFRHAWRRRGLFAAAVFLGGSFVFTGVEESMWILLGRFALGAPKVIPAAAGGGMVANGTYYFTKGFFWFLETPVTACFGWFFLAYSVVYMADHLIPSASIIARAALGGFLAVNVDFWVDPVQTHPHYTSWVWAKLPGGLLLFGIPLTNFIGWFLLIFLFAIVFDRLPAMTKKHGPARAVLRFYGLLMAMEIGILIFFMVYGAVEQTVFPKAINLTLWGIGS